MKASRVALIVVGHNFGQVCPFGNYAFKAASGDPWHRLLTKCVPSSTWRCL